MKLTDSGGPWMLSEHRVSAVDEPACTSMDGTMSISRTMWGPRWKAWSRFFALPLGCWVSRESRSPFLAFAAIWWTEWSCADLFRTVESKGGVSLFVFAAMGLFATGV